MKIDVSDLFDDLFTVAAVAHPRFRVHHEELNDCPENDWDSFCRQISNSLFLPACASRAYDYIAQRIPLSDIKRRIITPRLFGLDHDRGFNMWYSHPKFFWMTEHPCGFASTFLQNGVTQTFESLRRPEFSLTLHLGRLPEPEFTVLREPYDPNDDAPFSYYCRHGCQTMSGPMMVAYEVHGNWALRKICFSNALYRTTLSTPRWKPIENLVQIDKLTFEDMWTNARDTAE